jgi:hypothetical protein
MSDTSLFARSLVYLHILTGLLTFDAQGTSLFELRAEFYDLEELFIAGPFCPMTGELTPNLLAGQILLAEQHACSASGHSDQLNEESTDILGCPRSEDLVQNNRDSLFTAINWVPVSALSCENTRLANEVLMNMETHNHKSGLPWCQQNVISEANAVHLSFVSVLWLLKEVHLGSLSTGLSTSTVLRHKCSGKIADILPLTPQQQSPGAPGRISYGITLQPEPVSFLAPDSNTALHLSWVSNELLQKDTPGLQQAMERNLLVMIGLGILHKLPREVAIDEAFIYNTARAASMIGLAGAHCFWVEDLDKEGYFVFSIYANQKSLPVWGASTGYQYGLPMLRAAIPFGPACSYVLQIVDRVKEGLSYSVVLAYQNFLRDILITGPIPIVFADRVSKSCFSRYTCQNFPLAFKRDFSCTNVPHKTVSGGGQSFALLKRWFFFLRVGTNNDDVSALRKRLEHASPFKGENGKSDGDIEMSDSASSKSKRLRASKEKESGENGGDGEDQQSQDGSDNDGAPSENGQGSEAEEPMEHDQGSSGAVEEDDDFAWLDTFAGSKAAILAVSKDFETTMTHQDQGPVISEDDLYTLALRISGACVLMATLPLRAPPIKCK